MPQHQRRFSDSLVLEEDDRGSVLVSRINPDLSASQGLLEGDKIVGATIHFDHLTKNEVVEILKLIEPYDDKVQMLAKQDKGSRKSKSLGNLDRIKAPDEIQKDSYHKLFNAKVKKFLKENPDGRSQENTTSSINRQKAAQVLSHDNAKKDISNMLPNDLPAVDFTNKKVDVAACLRKVECREKPLKSSQSANNIGPLECQNDITDFIHNPRTPEVGKNDMKTFPNINAYIPNVALQKCNMDIGTDTHMSDSITRPGNLPEAQNLTTAVPDLEFHTHDKTPNINLGGAMSEFDPEVNYTSSDVRTDVSVGKVPNKKKSKNNVKTPKVNSHGVSEHKYNFDLLQQSSDLAQTGEVRAPELDEYNSELVSGQTNMKHGRVKAPELNIDAISQYNYSPEFLLESLKVSKTRRTMNASEYDTRPFKVDTRIIDLDSAKVDFEDNQMYGLKTPHFESTVPLGKPKGELSGILPYGSDLEDPKLLGMTDTQDIDFSLHNGNLMRPKLNVKTPDISSPKGKLEMPKLKMLKLNLPDFKSPETDVKDLHRPDLRMSHNLDSDISVPDIEIDEHKTPRFYMPDFGLLEPAAKVSDIDLSPPHMKGKINSPNLTDPEMNVDIHADRIKTQSFKKPNIDAEVPDIETPDFDISAPFGKMKMPKFGLSGTLPKGPGVEGPKIKGGIDAKDTQFTLPEADLRAPNLEIKNPDIDIDSPTGRIKMPKFKKPKFSLPGFKGPDTELAGPDISLSSYKLNAEFGAPDIDIDGPKTLLKGTDLKGPQINGGIDSPAMKMPKFGFSGKLPKSPDLKGPKFKGGIDSKDINLNLPECDLKTPNLDYNSPDIGIDGPAGNFKTPKFKTPKFSIPGFKGPKTDVKRDLTHPDFSLSSPRLDGEISAPDINIDGPKLKSSKPGLTLPDIDLPSGSVNMPRLKTPDLALSGPKVKAPKMDLSPGMIKGEINLPDFIDPDVNIDIPTGKIKGPTLKTPKVDMNAPEFDTDVPTGKLKMPKFGFSGNLPKGPNLKVPKLKGGIDTPNMDVTLSKPDLEGPNLNLKSPDMDINSPSGKLKMPTFKIPTLGHSRPKVKTPELDLSAPTFKGDLNSPDFNIKGHKPNVTMPDLDADIHTGKMKVPNLEKPNIDINVPEFDTNASTGKLKMPKFGLSGKLPKSPDLKGPKFKGGINGKDISLTLPETDLKTPNLDYNSPDIGIDGPAGNFKTPKFKTPKFSIPGFKGPKTDVKRDLTHPDFSLSSPRLDGEISAPDINIDGPKLKSSKPGLTLPDTDLPSGSVNMPRLKTPDLALSGPKVKAPKMDLSPGMIKGEINLPDFIDPDVNIDIPTGKIKGPTLKTPNVDMNAPEFNTDVPTGKLKMPKFGFSGNLPKGPNLKVPKLKGGIDTPNMDMTLSKPDLEGPNLNLKSPDMDINSPSRKLKMPTFKIPTLGHSRPKVKTPELDLSAPTFKGDLNSPDFNIKGHKPNVTMPDLDADIHTGKMKVPNLEKPNIDINVPEFDTNASTGKLKMSKFGLSGKLPKSPDLKGPKFKGGINGKDISLTLPETDLKTPNLDYNSPDIGIDGPARNFKMPKFKTPKFSIPGFRGPKTEVKGDLTHPDFSLSSPRLDGEISAPDINIDGPKLKSSKPGLTLPDIDLPSGSVNKPRLKTPDLALSGPKVKAPKMDLSPGMIKGEINLPDFIDPDVNIDIPTGKIKGPTLKTPKVDMNAPGFDTDVPTGKLKMPKFGFSGNLPKGPNLKVPKLKGGIDTPNMDMTLSKPDLEGPNLNLKSPDMDINSPSGKLKMPTFKIPTLGHSRPKVKTPELDISAPTFKGDINSPDFNIKGHKPNVTMPDLDADIHTGKMKVPNLEKPNIDINIPEFDTNASTGKLKMPKFGLSGKLPKSPDLKGPKFKGGINGKDISLTLPETDLKTPNLDYNSPDIGIDGPAGNFKTPKFKTPKFSIPGFKGPKTDVRGDLTHPNFSLSSPRLDGEISAPDINIDGPKLKSSKPGLTLPDTDLPSGSVNMPRLKTPDLALSGPKVKAPKMDLSPGMIKGDIISTDFTDPDVNVDIPTGKIKVPTLKTPKVDMKAPEFDTDLDYNSPDIGIDGSAGNFKIPKFSMPGLKGPKTDVKGNLKHPDLSFSSPNLDADISTPDTDEPKAGLTLPGMDLPSRKLKMPKGPNIKGPQIKGVTDVPDMNLKFHESNLRGPKLDVKSPDIDIYGPEDKLNMPRLKTPKFSISGFKGPNFKVRQDSPGTDLNLSSPKLNADLSGHNISPDGPKSDLQGFKSDLTLPDMDLPSGKVNIPRFKMPNFGLSGPSIKTPTMKGEINTDAASGKVKMSEFGLSSSFPKGTYGVMGGTDSPDFNVQFLESDTKGPKQVVKSPETNMNSTEGKFKTSRLKTPKFNIPDFNEPDSEFKGNLISSSPKFDAEDMADEINTNSDLKGPKPDLTLADTDLPLRKLDIPSFKVPDLEFSDSKLPKFKGKGEVNSPGIKVTETEFKAPDTALKAVSLKNKTNGSIKLTKDLDALVSNLDLDVPHVTLKKSKFKFLTIV